MCHKLALSTTQIWGILASTGKDHNHFNCRLKAKNTQNAQKHTWWRRGIVVTSLGISTKLLYIGPG